MPATTPSGDSTFWRFSLDFYAGPGVPDACLQLQEDCGADVNVVLYALFLARAGRLLDDADIMRIEALSSDWRDHVVRPLRRARRYTKTPPPEFDTAATAALRTDLKRIELEAERLQQLSLERNLPAHDIGTEHSDTGSCASRNLAAYARRLREFPQPAVAVLLRRLGDT
ncbi:MAG: TIGR02444 family protein [Hyphomicrobiales bacterium]|nr:TIGR02444 family protein [Hyphomicrobiales bacterium]